MAVFSMDHVHIIALKKDRKKILELLQSLGTVEVSDVGSEDDIFQKTNTSFEQNTFIDNSKTAANALKILEKHNELPKRSLDFLRNPCVVSSSEHEDFITQKRIAVLKDAQRVIQLGREICDAKAEILKIEAQEEMLVPWMSLPVPQTFAGTKKTAVFIGSIDGEHTLESITGKLAAAAPGLGPMHFELVSSTKELTCFYVIALKRDADAAQEALRSIGFTNPAAASSYTPDENKRVLTQKKKQCESAIEDAQKELTALAVSYDDIRHLEDDMNMRAEKYAVIERLIQTKRVFVLDGFTPTDNVQALEKALFSRFECAVEFSSATDENDAPIKLKNNKFAEPTEMVLEAYSLPGKGEVDPTNIMSIFYYIMFGLMFSDAGYGLILAAVCGFLLLKIKDMKPNWQRNLKLFFWCGISTIFWGVVFSSYFGDVVDVVSRNFFGNEVRIAPLWFYPMENPMLMLVFCLGIGVIHLLAAYIMKGITCAKNRDISGIIYDAVFPIGFILPLILILMGSEIFLSLGGFMLSLSPIVVNICIAIVLISTVGILLTGGRESKSWGKRLMKGAYALYNTFAGWLSDILSYSRLLALGLATGVIAGVMNQLGAMLGTGVLGMIAFVIVFCVGQTLNFGINVLGAYVHSNRLEYVEFFGKFYEGGGRKFTPFGMHTKYYKIREETQNG